MNEDAAAEISGVSMYGSIEAVYRDFREEFYTMDVQDILLSKGRGS